jgi:hypothetical protein
MTFRLFNTPLVAAGYTEALGGGDIDDIDAARNAPAKTPGEHLDKVSVHSGLDYLEAAFGPSEVTVNHAAVAAGSPPAGQSINFGWSTVTADHLLFTHNLGYLPIAFVAVNGNQLTPGMPVQVQGDGGCRYASYSVTETGLYLHESASVGTSNLAAVSLTYTFSIKRQPPAPSGGRMLQFSEATGVLSLAGGKVRSDRKYAQVADEGELFGIALGRTIDLANGAPRFVRPDGVTIDPVPAIQLSMSWAFGYGSSWGAPINYDGSFTGEGSVQLRVR